MTFSELVLQVYIIGLMSILAEALAKRLTYKDFLDKEWSRFLFTHALIWPISLVYFTIKHFLTKKSVKDAGTK